jgi:hypothetical protein
MLRSYKYIILAGLLVNGFFALIIIYNFFWKKPEDRSQTSKPTTTSHPTRNITPFEKEEPTLEPEVKNKFVSAQQMAKVGEETIYGEDLNYILENEYPADFASKSADMEMLKKKSLLTAIDDSVILQSGQKAGFIKLTPDIFNNINKEYTLRNKTVKELTAKFKAKEEKISGGMISIWFHNVSLPSIPLDEAEKLAKTKIEKVYIDIKSGKITFKEGGKAVQNDTELIKIDKNYKGNAIYEFSERISSQATFIYSDMETALWSLKEEEMSPVIRHPKEGIPLGSQQEEFYAIIKVYKRENLGQGSFWDWLEKEKEQYVITLY